MKLKFKLVIISLIIIVFSCNKKSKLINDVDFGYDYYPLTIGKYVVYDVDSSIYQQLPKDTFIYKYRIKEKISDSYIDSRGQTNYRIERYFKKYDPKKSYDSIPWMIKEVWLMNADNKSVQVLENNIRFTKLSFPVISKEEWDGNALNTLGTMKYSYEYIDYPEKINSTSFASVLKVNQYFFRTLLSLQNYSEKYARGVGLVYKEYTYVVNRKTLNAFVENNIDSGIVYKQSVVSYGRE